MTIADTFTAFATIWSFPTDSTTLIRSSLGASGSVTQFIQKIIERYLVAIPQWMSWNFVQQYFALY